MNAVSIHSSGDYLLVGTKQPALRIYDINTAQCFVGCFPEFDHKSEITCLAYVLIIN